MSTPNDRSHLLTELSNLLGFEDGADDLLHHILSINTEQDVVDYMTQLLGSETRELKDFAANVARFQRGENLVTTESKPNKEKEDRKSSDAKSQQSKTVAAKKSNELKTKTPVAATKNANKNSIRGSGPVQNVKTTPKNAATATKASLSLKNATTAKPALENKKIASPQKGSNKKESPSEANLKKIEKHAVVTLTGTPNVVCGCYGIIHKAVGNCLNCGRISCAREGLDFCAFCGHLVNPPTYPDGDDELAVKAWMQKEHILENQSKSAQRTLVLDDQADFHANSASAWITKEEAIEERQSQVKIEQGRKKQLLNLAV